MDDMKLDSIALDALLRDRAQFQGWLARLDDNTGKVPVAVTAKVRLDYEGRLLQVLDALKAHAGAVDEALTRLRHELSSIEVRDGAAAERLAEAELRHLVGEYDDDAWETLRGGVDGERRGLHADMEQARQEVARLADVQAIILDTPTEDALVAAPPTAPPEIVHEALAIEPEPMAPSIVPASHERVGAIAVVDVAEPVAETSTIFARPVPKAMDELDFLKSVTDDAVEVPAPAAKAATAATAAPDKGKSVRCRECGHDNRPSDWYCDRCGAEISDL